MRIGSVPSISRVFAALFLLVSIVVPARVAAQDPNNCAQPPNAMISWWRAEGDALDSLGNNNGSLPHGIAFAAGEVGQGFSFDGVSSVVFLGDPDDLKLTNSLTIEAWVFANNQPSSTHRQIFFRGDTRYCLDPYGLSIEPDGSFQMHVEDAQGTVSVRRGPENSTLPTGGVDPRGGGIGLDRPAT